MYEVEERPNREVCDKLKISESNLWVMLHRARRQLREELAGWWEGRKASNSKSQTPPDGETRNSKLEAHSSKFASLMLEAA